jgi:hypothetical protein
MITDIDDRSYVGLPDNLTVRDEHDLQRVFSVIPGFNHDTRRIVAAAIRSIHRSRASSRKSDADVIVAKSTVSIRQNGGLDLTMRDA